MTGNIFSSIFQYFRRIYLGVRSILNSGFTVLPYWVGYGENRKEVTEQYPDPVSSKTEDDLPPRSRGFLFNEIEKCTGCRDCQKVCPVNCISIETEPTAEDGKTWVSIFDIDFGMCLFCGLCVESCQPMSLVHTKKYEGATYQAVDLKTAFGRGVLSERGPGGR